MYTHTHTLPLPIQYITYTIWLVMMPLNANRIAIGVPSQLIKAFWFVSDCSHWNWIEIHCDVWEREKVFNAKDIISHLQLATGQSLTNEKPLLISRITLIYISNQRACVCGHLNRRKLIQYIQHQYIHIVYLMYITIDSEFLCSLCYSIHSEALFVLLQMLQPIILCAFLSILTIWC